MYYDADVDGNMTDSGDYGGYCDLNCIHCREEFLDSEGDITGDYSGGEVEYYCNLEHSLSYGSFCKDYEL